MKTSTPTHIALVSTCPHCKEQVRLILSKKEIKTIYKSFKLPQHQANLQTELKLHLTKP